MTDTPAEPVTGDGSKPPVTHTTEYGGLELVRQQHEYGCGVASLAMVTGETYDEVRQWILDNWNPAALGTLNREDWLVTHGVTQYVLDWYLAAHGFAWRRTYDTWHPIGWPPEPYAPVHIVQVIQPSDMAHFVVLTADGRVLDPTTDAPRSLSEWEQVNFVQGVWEPDRLEAMIDRLAEQLVDPRNRAGEQQ